MGRGEHSSPRAAGRGGKRRREEGCREKKGEESEGKKEKEGQGEGREGDMVNRAHSNTPPSPSPLLPPPSSHSQTTQGVYGKLLTLAGGELLQVLEGEGALGGEPQARGMMEGRLED